MWKRWCISFTILTNCVVLKTALARPSVDPGLFMILGVETCRSGEGYCFLGVDCTLDDDFAPDDKNGHCDGLKNAFTPPAHFTCCMYNTTREGITTTRRPRPGQQKPSTEATTLLQNTNVSMPNTTTFEPQVANQTISPPEPVTETTLVPTTATNLLETTTAEVFTETVPQSSIFIDVGNEVFKEVVPPALGQPINSTHTKIIV